MLNAVSTVKSGLRLAAVAMALLGDCWGGRRQMRVRAGRIQGRKEGLIWYETMSGVRQRRKKGMINVNNKILSA